MSLFTRLEAIEIIMSELNDNDLVISTTGMISREVFYIKERTSNRDNISICLVLRFLFRLSNIMSLIVFLPS